MPIRGLRPGGPGLAINRHPPVHRWTEVEDRPYTGGPIGLATELRNRERVLGTTIDSRRDLRIRYRRTRVVSAGQGSRTSTSTGTSD